jgi:hypothetical protein
MKFVIEHENPFLSLCIECQKDPFAFRLRLRSSDDPQISIVIRFEYTETYPITSPIISIDEWFPLLEDEDRIDLDHILRECAEENLKIPMVYTLANRVLEWFREDRSKRPSSREPSIMKVGPIGFQSNIENTDYHGTRVTKEAFLIWKKGFDEARTRIASTRNLEETKDTRLTGRQLFELDATLATSDTTCLLEEGEKITDMTVLSDEEEEEEDISVATEELLRDMKFSDGSGEKNLE